MKLSCFQPFDNNRGSTMIAALLMIAALSLTVFMASDSSLINSKMMRNNRLYHEIFYNAETGITHVLENQQSWLAEDSDLFDTDNKEAKEVIEDIEITDESGESLSVAECQMARIESSPDSESLSAQFPELNHKAGSVVGSGTSVKRDPRRYGIVSEGRAFGADNSENRKVTLEAGFIKFF